MEIDYPCVCGKRYTTERGIKIHRTKISCLNASTNQRQRNAQAGKTSENQSQVQNHSAGEIHAEESDEEFRQLINAKRQKIKFPISKRKRTKESSRYQNSPTTGQAHRGARALWSTNLPLSVTLSTRHVLLPSGLNNIKPQEKLRKVEGNAG